MKVGSDGVIKVLIAEFLDLVLMFLECRVIYQYIQLPQLANRLRNSLFTKLGLAYVARQKNAAASFAFHSFLCGDRVGVFIEINYGHISAFASEEDSDGTTDSGISAGDKSDHVPKLV